MKESELERILVNEVKKIGGKAYKWVSPGNDGVPDRIVFFPGGLVCFVELKADNGRLSAQQKVQHKVLTDLGQDVITVRGMDGLIDFLRQTGWSYRADCLSKRYQKEVMP